MNEIDEISNNLFINILGDKVSHILYGNVTVYLTKRGKNYKRNVGRIVGHMTPVHCNKNCWKVSDHYGNYINITTDQKIAQTSNYYLVYDVINTMITVVLE